MTDLTPTRRILTRDDWTCAFCGGRAVQRDHFITRAQARRSPRAAAERETERYQVAICRRCNEAKGPRLRVPESLAHLIPELEAITDGKYATFDGTARDLDAVVK